MGRSTPQVGANVVAGASLTQDNNVFRLADDASPPPGFSTKSDRISVGYAGVRIEQVAMLQRDIDTAQADLLFAEQQYARKSVLAVTA